MEKKPRKIPYDDKIKILTSYCVNGKNALESAKMCDYSHTTITSWWKKLSDVEKKMCEELACDTVSDVEVIEATKSFIQKALDTREKIIDVMNEKLKDPDKIYFADLTRALKDLNDVVKPENETTETVSIFDTVIDTVIIKRETTINNKK